MNLKKLFYLKELDSHLIIHFLGLRLMFKHRSLFKYKPATSYGVSDELRTPKLVVSLTSFPQRIDTVHLAINTLLRQSSLSGDEACERIRHAYPEIMDILKG